MALSPMMEVWKKVKAEYPECIVFFRLGDFYEMFFEDAEKASKLLDLTLTGRDCGLEKRAPMCGVPYQTADEYLSRLVEAGEKVAICEQIEDPKTAKGMVERAVVRVVSPGTMIESEYLDESKNNYIVCAVKFDKKFALAYSDITTGEFCVEEFEGKEKLLSALVNLSAAEIICNEELLFALKDAPELERGILPPLYCFEPWAFGDSAKKRVETQFCASLSALGLEGKEICVKAAGALLEYFNKTQMRALSNLNRIKIIRGGEFMTLDPSAVKNLELIKNNSDGRKYGSLLWLLDKTKTGMGARKLSSYLLFPLFKKEKIEERLDAVEELFSANVVRAGIEDMLSGVRDVERLAGRISNGNLQPRDCVVLSQSLALIPNIRFQLTGFSSKLLREIVSTLSDTKPLCTLLDSAISPDAGTLKDGNYIKRGYSKELDELKSVRENGQDALLKLEAREREKTGIRTLKVGYNRVFGYYIEVSNSFKEKVPYSYVRKQTLTGGERYITEELKELEDKILRSADRAEKLEESLFSDLCGVLLKNIPVLKQIAEGIALLDVIASFAEVSKQNLYARPKILSEGALTIQEGRHPVVEAISKERFVPNDCLMDEDENRTLIITGPNMAGKSTYLRQTALIVLMAQIGCFVPAKRASLPLCDRIFTRIGASDNLIMDRSTFMVEMTEVANILRNATKKSLLILDEVGRGTSTFDGLSIAWAVIEHLNEKVRAKTLFSTHYHELTELEEILQGVKNYKITAKESNGGVVFLRKVVRGGASRSFGVEVARIAGVPEEVTSRAKEILKKLEKNDVIRPSRDEAKDGLLKELSQLDLNALSSENARKILSDWKEKYQ